MTGTAIGCSTDTTGADELDDTEWIAENSFEVNSRFRGTLTHEATGKYAELATDGTLQAEVIATHISYAKNDMKHDAYQVNLMPDELLSVDVSVEGELVTLTYEASVDMIRKAVAKKVTKLMVMHKKMFREGAIKKGISKEVADAVWGDIEFFARYGFNRAHATDYAVITAQTAYLKAHYPIEFMTGLLTTERHNTEKVGSLIAECRRIGIEVQPPDINQSGIDFTIKDQENGASPKTAAIRFGLGAIKNVGEGPVEIILAARESGGSFRDLDDFCKRVDMRQEHQKCRTSITLSPYLMQVLLVTASLI